MEKYIVNGMELEYDTFDLESMEIRQKELETVNLVYKQSDGGAAERLRNVCNAILDFFDAVVGPGTAEKLFGSKVNVKVINDAFCDFNSQVNHTLASYKPQFSPGNGSATASLNREQRRAAQFKKKP